MQHHGIEITSAPKCLTFKIGTAGYVASDLAEAREVIDDVLSRACNYRGVLIAECDMGYVGEIGAGFEIGGKPFKVWSPDFADAVEACKAVVDRLTDGEAA